MAYSRSRRSSRRSSSRSYKPRRAGRRTTRRSSGRRGGGGTIRIVLEQPMTNPVAGQVIQEKRRTF